MIEKTRMKFGKALLFIVLTATISLVVASVYAEEIMRSEFQVKNLSCGSCLSRIAGELRALGKVTGMNADLAGGRVFVEHDASLSTGSIAKAITDIGYPATLITTGKKDTAATVKSGTGGTKAAPVTNMESAKDRMTTVLDVANLSCGSCLARISDAVGGIDPSSGVYGDLRARKVMVVHSDKVAAEKIAGTITALGYAATVFESKKGDFGPVAGDNQNAGLAADEGCSGSGCGANCGATSSSWKLFYDKYFSKK